MRREWLAGAGWLLLVLAPTAPAEVLYRCAGEGAAPRWQDAPCAAGEQQRTMEYAPEPARHPARAGAAGGDARAGARGHSARPPTVRSTRPRRDPRREQARAACAHARSLAAERTDVQGKRVPVRVIRERERKAGRACGD